MQQKMADYQEPAPEVSWDEISKAVADKKQQAKVIPMWLGRVAAAILLLVIAVVGYKALEEDASVSEKLADTPQQVMPIIQTENPPQDVPAEHPLLAKVTQVIRQAIPSKPVIEAISETPAVEDSVVEPEPASPEPASPEPASPEPEPVSPEPEHVQKTSIYPSELHKSTALTNRLTAKVYLSNAMGNSQHFSTSSYTHTIPFYPFNNPNIDNPDKNGPVEIIGEEGEINHFFDNQPIDTQIIETVTTTQKAHHNQPIRYGLSLRYRLNERWAVETGLTYSLLTSDITKTNAGQTTELKQRLNYIGIPLKAEYQLWGSRHFNVYASAGTLVEKMVKGSQETIGKGSEESVSIRPLQFSVSGAIGAEFNLSRQFSIYAEPGLGYYFDNGSKISTYYQDKPLNFNLNVGLRFQINGK